MYRCTVTNIYLYRSYVTIKATKNASKTLNPSNVAEVNLVVSDP